MTSRPLLAGILLTSNAFAQLSSFPKPSYFREVFARSQTKVELRDPVRLKDFVVDGKLELSLKSYLELVMANNTDIQLELLTVETPKNAIQRAMGSWDPQATARFSSTRSTTASTDALAGAGTVVSLSQPASFSYSQIMPTGTQYSVSFSGSKFTTNSSFSTLNPSLATSLSFNFTQPLLRNRGLYVNRIPLMVARSRYSIAGYTLKSSLISLVASAESAYWDVIQARENLRVAESGEKTAEEFLALNQKSLQLGALSPLDIYVPEQQLANAKLTVAQAQLSLIQAENALRKQIGADLDPDIRRLPIVVTETVDNPIDSSGLEPEAAVQKALASRPDLKAAMQNLDVDDLSLQSARNELLPNLSLTGTYTTQGIGGIVYQRTNVFDTSGNASQIVTTIPGGFKDSLSEMFGFGFPVYSFGLNLTLPIRSKAASADMADAVVSKKRDALTLRNTQQQIRLAVLNAVRTVEGSQEQVKLALTNQDYAVKGLDAENKKFQLGSEPAQLVLQAQTALTQAESSLVQSQIALRRSMLNLLMQTGELLDARGIIVK